MTDVLAEMTAGFADATRGAQRTFRVLLDVMARPGEVIALPAGAVQGIAAPPSLREGVALARATTASLLALLDAEVSVHLHGALASPAALAYLRFHTGVGVSGAGTADFVVARALEVDEPLWRGLALGCDEQPQAGATLLVEVGSLAEADGANDGIVLRLRGPGIPGMRRLRVGGPGVAFWQWRRGLQAAMPRGVDLMLCCGDAMAAVPRSTRIELEV